MAGPFNVAAAEAGVRGAAGIDHARRNPVNVASPRPSEADTLIRRAPAPPTMFQYVSAVGIAAIVMTILMVAAMLYLVWGALDGDAHTPSPDVDEQPELGDGDEVADGDEPQTELPADGNSA